MKPIKKAINLYFDDSFRSLPIFRFNNPEDAEHTITQPSHHTMYLGTWGYVDTRLGQGIGTRIARGLNDRAIFRYMKYWNPARIWIIGKWN